MMEQYEEELSALYLKYAEKDACWPHRCMIINARFYIAVGGEPYERVMKDLYERLERVSQVMRVAGWDV